MGYVIVNDTHLGLKRRSGVTPRSLQAYKKFQRETFKLILDKNPGEILIVLGDILDGAHIDYSDLWETYDMLRSFAGHVWLIAGNHDLSKNSEEMSAFDMLCRMLPVKTTTVFKEPTLLLEGTLAVVPHLANQRLFDEAVSDLGQKADVLLCHCNYDNGFAQASDHSLNLSPEQAALFDHVIMGHEHNKRDLPGIDILGSPYPITISECNVDKGYHYWQGPGHEVEFVKTWDACNYQEIDWRDLTSIDPNTCIPNAQFIRIVGEATAEEAAFVIDAVNKHRANSEAFFVVNSVKVGEIDLGSMEEVTEEALQGFDPVVALQSLLSEDHAKRLEGYRCA